MSNNITQPINNLLNNPTPIVDNKNQLEKLNSQILSCKNNFNDVYLAYRNITLIVIIFIIIMLFVLNFDNFDNFNLGNKLNRIMNFNSY